MSREPDQELDRILAEFYDQQREEARKSPPSPRRTELGKEAAPDAAPKPRETELPEQRRPRHAAPEPEELKHAAPAPGRAAAAPERKSGAETPRGKPERAAAEKKESRPAPGSAERSNPPQNRRTDAEKREHSRLGPGKGFAMMFLVLLTLAALLTGLLLWVVRDERAKAQQEPEPVRMELMEDLEQYLDESAGSSR